MSRTPDYEPEYVEYRVDPCGECREGTCDHCDFCKDFAENFPAQPGQIVRVYKAPLASPGAS